MAGAGSGLDPALRCAVEGQRAFFARLREQGAAAPRADDAAPSRMIAVGPPLDGGLDFRTPGGDAGASAQLFAGGVLPAAGAAGSAVGGDGNDGGKRLTSGGLDVCGGNGGDGAGGGGSGNSGGGGGGGGDAGGGSCGAGGEGKGGNGVVGGGGVGGCGGDYVSGGREGGNDGSGDGVGGLGHAGGAGWSEWAHRAVPAHWRAAFAAAAAAGQVEAAVMAAKGREGVWITAEELQAARDRVSLSAASWPGDDLVGAGRCLWGMEWGRGGGGLQILLAVPVVIRVQLTCIDICTAGHGMGYTRVTQSRSILILSSFLASLRSCDPLSSVARWSISRLPRSPSRVQARSAPGGLRLVSFRTPVCCTWPGAWYGPGVRAPFVLASSLKCSTARPSAPSTLPAAFGQRASKRARDRQAGQAPIPRGRWGEELVFRLLEAGGSRLPWPDGGGGEEEVEWVNAQGESGLPYDIVIRRRRRLEVGGGAPAGGEASEAAAPAAAAEGSEAEGGGAGARRDEPIFIEVKSTRDSHGAGPQPFPLSVNELLFALGHGPRLQARPPPRKTRPPVAHPPHVSPFPFHAGYR